MNTTFSTSSFDQTVDVFNQSWAKDFDKYQNFIDTRSQRAQSIEPAAAFPIPHQEQFAAKYNYQSRTYRTYFDEALRDNYLNALAMHRDAFIYELLTHRALAAILMDFTIFSDDPEDKEQKEVCNQFSSIVSATAKFTKFKRFLQEAVFFGKYAVQSQFGYKKINGEDRVVITRHEPVMGDKIVFDWEGTPAVMINPAAEFLSNPEFKAKHVRMTDRGMAFFLTDPFYRDRFVIHEFEPSDTDFLYESDMALSVHGLGVRSRVYWAWSVRQELMSWAMDGLQRVGVNGMLIGYYQAGNYQAELNMINALTNLMKNNITVIAKQMGQESGDMIQRIEPATIGYDVILSLVIHLEEIMRRAVLGQSLSSKAQQVSAGLGEADLAADSREHVLLYDTKNLEDTLNEQLIPVLLKYNTFKYKGKKYRGNDLPFSMSLHFNLDKRKASEQIEIAERLYHMNIPLDGDNLRDKAGFPRPKNNESTILFESQANPIQPGSRAVKDSRERMRSRSAEKIKSNLSKYINADTDIVGLEASINKTIDDLESVAAISY